MRLSTIIITLLISISAYAESFDNLHARYLKLRNTDTAVQKTQDWEEVSKDLLQYVVKNPQTLEAPSALYDVARLNETVYRTIGGKDRLELSILTFERLAKEYPQSELADDSLVQAGELRRKGLGDIEGAKRNFEEVTRAYRSSDMYEVARTRLLSISGERLKSEPDSDGEASIARENEEEQLPASLRKKVIVLDPGHGGEDFGALGPGGILEKDVVLDIALRVEKILKQDKTLVVRLTRRSDKFVPLADRTNLANDFEADIFVSLHVNASPGGKLSGLEAYYLDNTNDQSSKKLAERENQSLQFEEGADLQFILSDLIQSAKLEESIMLTNTLYRTIKDSLQTKHKGLKGLGVKRAPFYVLVGAHMPCTLLELFFIDHESDGALLSEREFRDDLARAISQGITTYLSHQ